MRRIHGVNGWRQLLKLIADDRALRYEKPGEQLYLPHATIDYVNDIPCWPVPEAEIVFNEIKKNDAPLYQNKRTVESVELLLNYNVNSFVGRVINTPVMMVVRSEENKSELKSLMRISYAVLCLTQKNNYNYINYLYL